MKLSERTLVLVFNALAEVRQDKLLNKAYKESGSTGTEALRHASKHAQQMIRHE